MTMTTTRPAGPQDVPTLGRLGALLVALHHDFDPERFINPTPKTPEAYGHFLAGEMGRSGAIVMVAEKEKEVVGYAYGGLEGKDYMALRGPAGVLYDLVVDPAHRREGIGRTLLDAALAALQKQGAPRVVVSTAYKNDTAQGLFASSGFRNTMVEMTSELTRRPEND